MERLQKIFADDWACRRHELDSLMTLVLPSVAAGNLKGASEALGADGLRVEATALPYLADRWELGDTDIPRGAVALIYLTGMLYSWETVRLVESLRQAAENPAIAGVVLVIDGPGGMTARIDQGVAAIRDFPKPIATLVAGCMASAHFWLGTSARRTFIASPLCEVGSVGVIFTYTSFKKYFETAGIRVYEIYADTADLKNKEVRDLENGDDTLIREKAGRLHRRFCEDVARNLRIEYDAELPLFRGASFLAEEAVSKGYIDAMGSLEDAVCWVVANSIMDQVNKNT